MDRKMKDIAIQEAKDRMTLLGIREEDIDSFAAGELTKVNVIHSEKKIIKESLTSEELEMIRNIEDEMDLLVCYVIKDAGLWPDGCEFERYTLAIVDTYVEDYDMIREDCIKTFHTLPAYVVNMEVPEYSEREEISYRVFDGLMISAS